MGGDGEAEDGDSPSSRGGLMCDRCGRLFPVRTIVVTAQAEVLCRACFDAGTVPTRVPTDEARQARRPRPK